MPKIKYGYKRAAAAAKKNACPQISLQASAFVIK